MKLKLAAFTALVAATLGFQTQAQELNVEAAAYFLGHVPSNTAVLEKNADERIEPASLTKLMTLALLFEALENGTVTMESELPISEKAWRMGGSKMFLEVGKTAKVADLIPGIAAISGNDACIVVAEYLGGSEEAFATMMNQKAEALGMKNSHFANASGWPAPDQYTTARDMYILAKHVANKYPQYYSVFSTPEFTYNGIRQYNRNLLLSRGIGVDGMKTGHVEEAGYHLVSSAKRDNDRLVAVVLGTKSSSDRAAESAKMLNYVFTNYVHVQLASKGEAIEIAAAVTDGIDLTVPLVVDEDLYAYIPRREEKGLQRNVSYTQPLVAPLMAGQKVGELQITNPANGQVYTADLKVAKDVAEVGIFEKMKRKALGAMGL